MSNLEFKLPDIGEGVHEGEIVRWIVPEGGDVSEDDPVVEVMTDKATVEIPAPSGGTVSKHMVAEGDVAEVGSVIFVLDTEGGGGNGSATGQKEAPSAAVAASQEEPEAEPGAPEKPAPEPSEPKAAPVQPQPADPDRKVLAAPATRRLARELGVDLSTVSGSGPNGRVKPEDVKAAAEAPAAPAAAESKAAPAAEPEPMPLPDFPRVMGERKEERTAFRGVRKLTADAMVRSKTTAPHFSLVEEVDATELKAVRKRAKEMGGRYGVNVTYMPYIMKAAAIGLQEFPQLNSMLDEETNEIVTFQYVNLGVAVDTPRGLMVPVVEDAHLKGVLQLASEVQDLATRARDGKIKPDELRGSTFSITNAGNIGGVFATPIINFPNVAIMGVHAMRRLPRVMEDDSIVPRDVMLLSISIDHRLVDGADGARFMVRVRELLEDPSLMLL